MTVITVVVATRSRLVGEGLRVALTAADDIVVVAVATDGPSVLHAAEIHHPDAVVVDTDLPGVDTRTVCRRLKAIDARQRVVLVFDVAREATLGTFVAAGADGIVLATDDTAALQRVIRSVHAGELSIPRALVRPLVESLLAATNGRTDLAGLDQLSDREGQVLQLLADGHGHRTIATSLAISPHTARTHIQNVMRKLDAHSRVEAIAVGLAHGLVR